MLLLSRRLLTFVLRTSKYKCLPFVYSFASKGQGPVDATSTTINSNSKTKPITQPTPKPPKKPLSQSKSPTQLIQLLKSHTSLTHQQLLSCIHYFLTLSTKKTKAFEWKSQNFIQAFYLIEGLIVNQRYQLTAEEAHQLCGILYMLFYGDGAEESERKDFVNLTNLFQVNFKQLYQKNQILRATHKQKQTALIQQTQNLCKYYLVFYSDILNINFKVYSSLASEILTCLSSLSSAQKSKLSSEILINILYMYSNRYEMTVSDLKVVEKVVEILGDRSGNQGLSDREMIRVYFVMNLGVLRVRAPSAIQFQARNKNYILEQWIKNIPKSLCKYEDILYFVQKCPGYNNTYFTFPLYNVFNYYISGLAIEDFKNFQDYGRLFKILNATAGNSYRKGLEMIMSEESCGKVQAILEQYVIQQKELQTFLDMLEKKLLPTSILQQLLPHLLQKYKNQWPWGQTHQLPLIFLLAANKIFSPHFLPTIASINFTSLTTKDMKLFERIQALEVACINVLYMENIGAVGKGVQKFETVYEKELRVLEGNTLKFYGNLGEFGDPAVFFDFISSGIENRMTHLDTMHQTFKSRYFDQLTSKITSQTIIKFLQYSTAVCQPKQFDSLLQKPLSSLITLPILTKLLWHYPMPKTTKKLTINITKLLYSHAHFYQNPKIPQLHIKQLCTFLSEPKIIQNIDPHRIGGLLDLIAGLVGTRYERDFVGKKVSKFLGGFLARDYSNVEKNLDFVQFVRKVLQQSIDNITDLGLLQKLLLLALDFNLLSPQLVQKITSRNFEFTHPYYRQLYRIVRDNAKGSLFINISKQLAQEYPAIVLRHSGITEEQLRKLERQVVGGIGKYKIQEFLPKMKDNYELTFLTLVLRRITQLLFSLNRSLLSPALHCLQSLINSPTNSLNPIYNLTHPQNPTHAAIVADFEKSVRQFLEKVMVLMSKNGRYMHMHRFATHNQMLNLGFSFGVSHAGYCRALLDMSAQFIQANPEDYGRIFMKISKIMLIKSPTHLLPFESSPIITPQLCNKYLYELITLASTLNNPVFYLHKVLENTSSIDELTLKYIEKIHRANFGIAKGLGVDENRVRVCQARETSEILEMCVKEFCEKNGYKFEIVGLGSKIRMYQASKQQQKRLYGILTVHAKKISSIFHYSLCKMLAEVYGIRKENIFITIQWDVQELFQLNLTSPNYNNNKNIGKDIKLEQFEAVCQKISKYQQIL